MERVAELIAARKKKGEIKRICNDEFGVNARTAEGYITRARKELEEHTTRPAGQYLSEAIDFYERVIREPMYPVSVRMKAQHALNRIKGLYSPDKHEISGAGGKPIQTEDISRLTPEQLRIASDAADRIERMERGEIVETHTGGNGKPEKGS